MSDAIRRASGISDQAPRWGKGTTQADLVRHSWIKTSGIGEVPFTYEQLVNDLDTKAGTQVALWVEDYKAGRTTKGLLLTGPPGAGKTTLARAIGLELLENAPLKRLGYTEDYDLKPVRPVGYWAWADYIKAVQRRMSLETRGQVESEEFHHLDLKIVGFNLESDFYPKQTVRLAILDDIGKEYSSGSGWTEGFLDGFLRTRGGAGLLNVATTNVALANWAEKYGDACGSYGHEAFTEVMVIGKDRRK